MKIFNLFEKKKPPVTPTEQQEDEYIIDDFVPMKIIMTKELALRQRSEKLKKNYCNTIVKTGDLL